MTPPNNKLILIALLLVAYAVQPSAAIRAEGLTSAPAPALVESDAGLPTSPLFPPGFPCSILPGVLRQICNDLFAPLKECGSSLAMMKPCAEFLTSNGSVSTPSDECCHAYYSFVNSGANICLCRLAIGDVGQILPTPLNMKHLFKIPKKCHNTVTLEPYTKCWMDSVPPIDPPSPPPSDDDDYTD